MNTVSYLRLLLEGYCRRLWAVSPARLWRNGEGGDFPT